ncbi:MAG: EAL domain-containing protein [Symbiopectobacterium sp.]
MLLTTEDLAAGVADVLKRHGLPAEALEIELTKNIALNNNIDSIMLDTLQKIRDEALEIELTKNIALNNNIDSIMLDTLQKIRDMGVSIAFDDFGTGYASLSILNQYPVTRIKIDRSFIQNLLTSRCDARWLMPFLILPVISRLKLLRRESKPQSSGMTYASMAVRKDKAIGW